ncbi:uncharacterized protein ABDE67_020548 [Symphorus nematophorus]
MSLLESGRQFFYNTFFPTTVKYHGLLNQGATCYLNSVLQVLFMTEDFRAAVERHTCENPDTECIDPHLKTLFDDLKERTAYTYKITKKLGIDRVYEQRDAAEYFEKILNLTSPDASKIFHGKLTNKIVCSACGTETDSNGAFWHLPLALVDSYSEHYSVLDGIEEYFRTSHFSGENQMYCDRCDGKSDATTKCVIKDHPKVLMLLLKRFEFDYRYMTYVKINRIVDVPCTVQIPENQKYELYAVVEHFGDLRSGHYTAMIKDDERWYKFNDNTVTLLDYHVDNFEKRNERAADTCTQDSREVSAPGGSPPATSDACDQRQDALQREDFDGTVEVEKETVVAVSMGTNEETVTKDRVESRGAGPSPDLCFNVEDQDKEVYAGQIIPNNHQGRNDLSYLQDAHAETQKDEVEIEDKEDMGGNAEAEKRETLSRETHLEERIRVQDMKYYGLLNQGATCYLNSVLQVLFMTKDFRAAVESHKSENHDTDCIDPHLKALFDDLKREAAVTCDITKKLGIDRVYEQRDAAEYFEKILNLTSPEASKIFHGKLTNKIVCSACGTETDSDGAFWHLPLALVNSYSEHYSVKCVIKDHPKVLVLLLKRFEFDYRYMTYVKINRIVDVPCTLRIPENQKYELYAVVEHFGDLRSGHYTTTIKDDERWYNFDDNKVMLLDNQPFHVDNFEK